MTIEILPENVHKNGLYEAHSKSDFGIITTQQRYLRTEMINGKSTPIYDSKPVGMWHHCREVIHSWTASYNSRKLMFRTRQPGRAIAFLEQIQDKIKLKGKDRVLIQRTQHKHIVLVTISDWWWVDMRRSLLTILLRSSRTYVITKQDIWTAVEGNKYLGNQNALKRFLRGHTLYKGSFHKGWSSALAKKPKTTVNKLLVKS